MTYAAKVSCPDACPLKGAGCYAEFDNVRTHWNRVEQGAAGLSAVDVARREAELIDDLPADRDLRLHEAGDSKTAAGTELIAAAADRYVCRAGAKGLAVAVWGYTHAWRTVPRLAWGGVAMLASCETPADVALAARRGYAAAVVLPHPGRAAFAWGGYRAVPCPAQTTDGVTCVTCRLCFNTGRLRAAGLVIAFDPHGSGRNKAAAAVKRLALPVVDAA